MSSDSEKLPNSTRRRRQIVSDSDSSDDSFINTNRKKRKVGRVVSEEDSSDDDSDIPQRTVQKRKNHKLVSEDEFSYDSSSSNEGVRSNFDGGSTSSEWQSDWQSMDEDTSEAVSKPCDSKCKKSPKKSSDKDQPGTSCDSESSDSESDKCPICLLSFRKQEVANPAVCEHCFCLDCLTEWSKNVNTCPVDRQTFTIINVRAKIGGKIIRYVPIEATSQVKEVVQEDPTYCEICHRCDREDRMLLCDGCDSGYHLECLDPPMDEVPFEEHWYCPECSRNSQNDAEDIEIDLDEVPDLLEEARLLGFSYGRSRASIVAQGYNSYGRRSNLVPRTRQTERIRANVRADRSRRAAAVAAASVVYGNDDVGVVARHGQPSTSSSGIDTISENSRSRSPVAGTSGLSRRARRASSPVTASGSGTSARSSRRTARKSTATRTKKTKRKKRKRNATRTGSEELREVRITEYNENGELEEIVTYVRASASGPAPSGRRRKKRKVLSDYDD